MAVAFWVGGLGLIGLAGLLHIGFFLLQTVLWERLGRRTFGVRPELEAAVRPWATNQGWYNLFLAFGATGSAVVGITAGETTVGIIAAAIGAFVAAVMVGAAIVLLATDRRLARGALLQGVPPLLGLIGLGAALLS